VAIEGALAASLLAGRHHVIQHSLDSLQESVEAVLAIEISLVLPAKKTHLSSFTLRINQLTNGFAGIILEARLP